MDLVEHLCLLREQGLVSHYDACAFLDSLPRPEGWRVHEVSCNVTRKRLARLVPYSYAPGGRCLPGCICRRCLSIKKRKMRLSVARWKGTHSKDEWAAILDVTDGLCAACGSGLFVSKDHVVPLCIGGSDAASNLQPLCRSCNTAKGLDCTDYLEGRRP